MKRILELGGRTVWAAHVVRPFSIESPFDGLEFALLLDVRDPAVTRDEQNAFSDRIVATGCRHAAIRGFDGTTWDDAIDGANLARFDYDVPENRHVLTSWFTDETFEEVVEFVEDCQWTIGVPPNRFLVVCLGGSPADYEDCRTRAIARFTLAWT